MSRFTNIRAVQCSNDEYHSASWDSLSASRLKTISGDPQAYYQQFITGEMDRPDSNAMAVGRTFHEVVLEQPVVFDRDNFGDGTVATWNACRVPDSAPDLVDSMGAEYWWREEPIPGVVRRSDHWGQLADCVWTVNGFDNGDGRKISAFVAFQDMLLNGHGFIAIPADVLNSDGYRKGKAWDAFRDSHDGQLLLRERETRPNVGWRDLAGMRREIREHKLARELLMIGDGGREYAIYGTDAHYGVEIRTRIDKYRIFDGKVFVADIKTTTDADPSAFSRQAIKLRMPMQAYIMSQLAAEHFQMPVYYRYVAIDKKPPYRCEVFEVEPELVEIGEKMLDEALKDFCNCRDSGIWRPRSHGKLNTIHTPQWMMRDNQLSWNHADEVESEAEPSLY